MKEMKISLIAGFVATIAVVVIMSIWSTHAITRALAYGSAVQGESITADPVIDFPSTSPIVGQVTQTNNSSQDKTSQIATLQEQYDQLSAQYQPIQHEQNIWAIGLKSAQQANVPNYRNPLSAEDTATLGVYYSNLFLKQSNQSFQDNLASFQATTKMEMDKNEAQLAPLRREMKTVMDQILALKK